MTNHVGHLAFEHFDEPPRSLYRLSYLRKGLRNTLFFDNETDCSQHADSLSARGRQIISLTHYELFTGDPPADLAGKVDVATGATDAPSDDG